MSIKIGIEAHTLEEVERLMKWWHYPSPLDQEREARKAHRKAKVPRVARHQIGGTRPEYVQCPVEGCGKRCKIRGVNIHIFKTHPSYHTDRAGS